MYVSFFLYLLSIYSHSKDPEPALSTAAAAYLEGEVDFKTDEVGEETLMWMILLFVFINLSVLVIVASMVHVL
jgi:hypothetical protein